MSTKRKRTLNSDQPPGELVGVRITVEKDGRIKTSGVGMKCTCGSDKFHIATWDIDNEIHIQCPACQSGWVFDAKMFVNQTQTFPE